MKGPSPVDRALQLRKAAPLRERGPQKRFYQRMEPQVALLGVLKVAKASEEVLQEARRMFLVALAAAFELYWREFFRLMVNRYAKKNHGFFSHLTKTTVSVGELARVMGEKLTLGEIVACAHSFQGPEALSASASSILRLDAFAEFRKKSWKLEILLDKSDKPDSKHKPFVVNAEKLLATAMPALARCYDIRNEAVHDLATAKLSVMDILEIENQVSSFNVFFSSFVEAAFDDMASRQ